MPFYEWTLPDSLLNELLDLVKKVTYTENSGNLISDGEVNYKPLTEFVKLSLDELKEFLYPGHNKFKIVPTQIWSNKTEFMQKQHRHTHHNSTMSGIIYLTSDKDAGATRFWYRDIFYHHESFILPCHGKSNPTMRSFDVSPELGKMIIFPSNIVHETTAHKGKDPRYTISFNSFFSGQLGELNTRASATI